MSTPLEQRHIGAGCIAQRPLERRVSGWIPVAEKQPEVSGTYAWVTIQQGRKKPYVDAARYWIQSSTEHAPTGWATMDDDELDGVIAWEPMPEPYAPNAK